MKKFLFVFIMLVVVQELFAQDSSSTREEVWPEVNVYYKINDKLRLFALYSATKLKNSSYTDGGYGICVDYFGFPWLRKKIDSSLVPDTTRGYYLWLRAGYLYSSTPSGVADPVSDNTILTEANARFHLPYEILLTNKNRVDWRIVNGDFKPRYRFRLNFEKDMHTDYLSFTPYFFGEYFINMYEGGADLNRFRFCAGSELKVATHINFEMYWLHQFDNGKDVDALNAVGFVLKFYFNHQTIKQKFLKKNK